MSFFEFLDNRFRNLGLDNSVNFSLQNDGHQQAAHAWVLGIRKFFKTAYFVLLPIVYIMKVCKILKTDPDYSTRYADIKAYTDKTLAEARAAQLAGQPVPVNQDSVDKVLNENQSPVSVQ